MKKTLIILVVLGGAFALSLGLHSALITVANGASGWADSARVACSICHGG